MTIDPITGLPSSNSPSPQIDASKVGYTSPVKVPPVPQDTTPYDTIASSAVNSVLADYTGLQQKQEQMQKSQEDSVSYQGSIMNQLAGITADTQAANTLTGVDTETANLNKYAEQLAQLNAQAQSLNREAQAAPILNTEANAQAGRVTTTGVAQGQTEALLRQNALKALSIGQQSDIAAAAATGSAMRLQAAKDKAQQMVDLKYEPLKAALKREQEMYELNKDLLISVDKKRAEALQLAIKRDEQMIAEQKETEKAIQNIGITLRKYGVADDVVQNVLSSDNVNDALLRAGNNLQDPAAKIELEGLRLDNVLKRGKIAQQQRETQLLGEPTAAERKEIAAAVKEAKASIPATQDKIDAVTSLVSHKGLQSRVGTSIVSRTPTGALSTLGKAATIIGIPALGGDLTDKLTGSGQDFAGGVHKLTSGLSIDNLIAAKARGATFGALSDSELRILSNAASAINDWEVKDDNGVGQGVWNIDEKSFKKELNTIQELSRRALQQSQGTLYTPEEQKVMDEMFPQETASASQYFN